MEKKTNRWGWAFLIVASAMIMIFSFYPMVAARFNTARRR